MTDRAGRAARLEIVDMIDHCTGHAVADVTCALARALDGYRAGTLQSADKEMAVDQLVRLQNLYARAQAAGFSLERFDQVARYRGTIVLRERLGEDVKSEALDEIISWSLELLRRAVADGHH